LSANHSVALRRPANMKRAVYTQQITQMPGPCFDAPTIINNATATPASN
jgi:hypothetical protein